MRLCACDSQCDLILWLFYEMKKLTSKSPKIYVSYCVLITDTKYTKYTFAICSDQIGDNSHRRSISLYSSRSLIIFYHTIAIHVTCNVIRIHSVIRRRHLNIFKATITHTQCWNEMKELWDREITYFIADDSSCFLAM